MTFEKDFNHHLSILNRIHDHPERYNQIEVTTAVLNAKDFFCLNPAIPDHHQTWYKDFHWHELFTTEYFNLMEMAEKTRIELQKQNL